VRCKLGGDCRLKVESSDGRHWDAVCCVAWASAVIFRGRTGVRTSRAFVAWATHLTYGEKRRAAWHAGCEWAVLGSNQ
jgi:hypothetical protein